MPQTRENARLNTYLLYHEKDLEYYHDLETHIWLMLDESGLGHLCGQNLQTFNLRDRGVKRMLEMPSCLLCLITPAFIRAIRQESFLWSELVRAHLDQQLLILPIMAEETQHYQNLYLLRKIPMLFEKGAPLSDLRKQGDYSTHLANLAVTCRERIEQTLLQHDRVGKYWERTRYYNDADAYETFGEDFSHSKYGPEAQSRKEELLEEELWKSAIAFDDTAHYLHYLTESPLEKYRDQAVERIVMIELDQELTEEDVEENSDIGLVFDYKWRFRSMMDYELVQDKIHDTLGVPVRLEGDHPWPELEAQFLKRKVYEECSASETLTYSMLEEYAKHLRIKSLGVKNQLKKKREEVVVRCFMVAALIFTTFIGDALLDIGFYLAVGQFMVEHYFFTSFVVLILAYLLLNTFKYTNREMVTCDTIVKGITKELVHLKLAFIIRTEYGQCLRELHNMEEWGVVVKDKPILDYAFGDEEEMEFHSHTLRKMEEPKQKK